MCVFECALSSATVIFVAIVRDSRSLIVGKRVVAVPQRDFNAMFAGSANADAQNG